MVLRCIESSTGVDQTVPKAPPKVAPATAKKTADAGAKKVARAVKTAAKDAVEEVKPAAKPKTAPAKPKAVKAVAKPAAKPKAAVAKTAAKKAVPTKAARKPNPLKAGSTGALAKAAKSAAKEPANGRRRPNRENKPCLNGEGLEGCDKANVYWYQKGCKNDRCVAANTKYYAERREAHRAAASNGNGKGKGPAVAKVVAMPRKRLARAKSA